MLYQEHRATVRYEDFARIQAPDVCVFPGVLIDISDSGCRVRFPASVSLDTEGVYEINVVPSCKLGLQPFGMTVQPVWADDGADASEIGFEILSVTDSRHFDRYLEVLHDSSIDSDELLLQNLCR